MNQFLPHGFCFSWRTDLVFLHVVSDILITLSYFSIPITILLFMKKKQKIPFKSIPMLFLLFIFFCGTTHLISLITIWEPIYFTAGVMKALTAIISVMTAIAMWIWMPKILLMPTTKELQEVNKQLQEERDFTHAVLNTVDALIVVLDPHGRIIRFNQACEKASGYTAQEVDGKYVLDLLIPPEERDQVLRVTQDLKVHPNRHQNHWISKSDEYRLISWSNNLIRDEDGSIMYCIATGIDITQQDQMEKELHQIQKEFRETVRQHQGLLFKFKKTGDRFIYTLCDGALLHQTNTKMEEIINKSPEELFPPHISSVVNMYNSRAWNGENPVFYEMFLNNGIPVSVCLTPICRDNKVIEVIGTGADISERKRYEWELQQAKDQLEFFFQNSQDGIMVKDLAGNILKVNQAIERMLGWSESEFTGVGFANAHIPLDYIDECNELIEKTKSGEEIIGYETVRQRKDGAMIIVQMTLSPIKDSEGNMIGTSHIMRDITEYKKADELLRKWERISSVGEMAAGIAHEIRNPLTTLKGFVHLMKKDDKNNFYLQIIETELNRIEMITNEFLMLAKPQAVHFKPVSVMDLLNNVILIANMQAMMKSLLIELNVSSPAWNPIVFGEENQLKQVLINLFKNAIEAMPENGTITVKVFREEATLVLQMIDEGCGISSELLPRLGEPFYTLKEKGTGLGLMVCFKIIREHKGTIEFESEEEKGTKVTIKLPLFEN